MANVGRPSGYTQTLADDICEKLATGQSLRSVCRAEDMPCAASVFKWLRTHPDFAEQYTRAKQESADALAEDLLEIADDGTNDWMDVEYGKGNTKRVIDKEAVQRSHIRIETRKWLMSKMKPKKYGDKLDLTTLGNALPVPILGGLSVANNTQTTSQKLPRPIGR